MIQEISLRGLRCPGHHGVFAFERERGQLFVIDVELAVEVGEAVATDDIALTVDYSLLARRISEDVAGEPVNLIETLAQRLLELVLRLAGDGVQSASVTVHKPEAPLEQEFSDVAVTAKFGR